MPDVTIRRALAEDAAAIHELICALARFEREPDAVLATPETLADQMRREPPPFECLLAELDGRAVGFALWFTSFSTWRGRTGLWLEDLFVREEARGRGIGVSLLRAVGRIAVDRGAGRLEFSVLDWNEPAIRFYRELGAVPMDQWTIFRFEGGNLARFGGGAPSAGG